MLITINQSDGTPIYLQLVRQVKQLIATGRLGPGDELPTVRALAQDLVINPNTVARAYRELEAAGLVCPRRGAGTVVTERSDAWSAEEAERILAERLDGIIVEARTLGVPINRVVDMLREREQALPGGTAGANTEGERP